MDFVEIACSPKRNYNGISQNSASFKNSLEPRPVPDDDGDVSGKLRLDYNRNNFGLILYFISNTKES
ncbi:hypothetical protein NST33_03535 [Paenibacillus sp. FSL L8-0435]|uniref:hypothetical protein n=1 Tax=Paenibacillus sp. FSL L8-0435 TaxID=2954618 RepID=UPI0030D7F4F5